MITSNIIDDIFSPNERVAKKADFLSAGMKEQDIYALCNQGYIKRIKNGFYMLATEDTPTEEALLSSYMTQGIICVESALFYYGYSDFTPRKWSIAVPRSFSRTVKAIEREVPVKAYYVQNEMYTLGKTTGNFNGVSLPVYDRERTICDCFKYRTKLDNETFNKAVRAYAFDQSKDLTKLLNYAKIMGVYKRMMSIMEVLLDA